MSDIDSKVWEATAPQISVRFNADSAAGITVPSGGYTAKQKIAAPVTFSVTNPDYAFIRWEAYLGETILNPGQVFFDNPRLSSTGVTVLLKTNEITLKPKVQLRPRVMDYQPDSGVSVAQVRDIPIVVHFSVPIAEGSFIWSYTAQGAPVKRIIENPETSQERHRFKNITIEGRGNFGNNSAEQYESYFEDPVLAGETLTLNVKKDKPLPSNTYLYITLSKDITDKDFVGLPDDVTFRYAVSSGFDTDPPLVNVFMVSLDGETIAKGDGTEKVQAGDTIYFAVSAFDQITKTGITNVYINENPVASGEAPATRFYYLDQTNTTNDQIKALIVLVAAKAGEAPASIFVIGYTVKAGPAGQVAFTVEVEDSSGNVSAAADAPLIRLARE
jgi:hypothetical protein